MNPNSHKNNSLAEFIQAYERVLKNLSGAHGPQPKKETLHVSFDKRGCASYKVITEDVKKEKLRITHETSQLVNELEQINHTHYLQVKIDQALEVGDRSLFMQLSSELNELMAY